MCTVSWQFHATGYQLCFNRDEKRTRVEAEPPEEHTGGPTVDAHWLAPIDPEGGGTWLFVNNHGLCGFILNDYGTPVKPINGQALRSRGCLLWDLAQSADADCFAARLHHLVQSAPYRPFRIGVLGSGGRQTLHHWTGEMLSAVTSDRSFLTSSSFDTDAVEGGRRMAYRKHIATRGKAANTLTDFHHQYWPDTPHASSLMRRSDARTVSISRVDVNVTQARFSYQPVRDSTPPTLLAPCYGTLDFDRGLATSNTVH